MNIVFVGFGVVSRTLLSMLVRQGRHPASSMVVVCDSREHHSVAEGLGVKFIHQKVDINNYKALLSPLIKEGDLLLNLAVGVSSADLIVLAQGKGALYLDTCVEPWEGGYQGSDIRQSTNAWLRHDVLRLSAKNTPTAIVAHGANPGLISHFLKQALIELSLLMGVSQPHGRDFREASERHPKSWAHLSRALGVQVVQIAERDTQANKLTARSSSLFGAHKRFLSTWSPVGLMTELAQPLECGWGTHEGSAPVSGQFNPALTAHPRREMYWPRQPGPKPSWVRSWVPSVGEQQALAISHHEALSISQMLTIESQSGEGDVYRPTCYYAYRPNDFTLRSIDRWVGACTPPAATEHSTVCLDAFDDGCDELGILLCTGVGAFWYGSTLEAHEAKNILADHSCGNATSVQVAAAILGAIEWMRIEPMSGVVEAETMDHKLVLEVAKPYLGRVHGHWSSWCVSQELLFDDFLTGAKI